MPDPLLSPDAPPARRGRTRDRRGRGLRGPEVLGPAPGVPGWHTRRERFDRLVQDVVADLEERWADRLGLVEFAVEDAPTLPDDWTPDTVPLSALLRGTGGRPTRLVVFRRPIEHRCETREDLEAMVLTVVVEQVAELLGVPAHVVDDRVDPED